MTAAEFTIIPQEEIHSSREVVERLYAAVVTPDFANCLLLSDGHNGHGTSTFHLSKPDAIILRAQIVGEQPSIQLMHYLEIAHLLSKKDTWSDYLSSASRISLFQEPPPPDYQFDQSMSFKRLLYGDNYVFTGYYVRTLTQPADLRRHLRTDKRTDAFLTRAKLSLAGFYSAMVERGKNLAFFSSIPT